MQIPFNLSSVFCPDSSSQDDAYVLSALLEVLIVANRTYLRTHTAPPLYRSGVRYARTDDWLSIPDLYSRKFGDCKSLACVRVVELRREGIDADFDFRWVKRPSDAGKDFHILVKKVDPIQGFMYEDPSRILGMGKDEVAKFYRPESVQGEYPSDRSWWQKFFA
jgi:hypothetical protein